MDEKDTARFMARIDRNGANGCWVWTGKHNGDGYGELRLGGKSIKTHRIAYELWNTPIPKGLCVLHRCDNPICVNPQHLFVGTQLQNIADRVAKGRSRCGRGDNHGFRLHPELVPRGEQNGMSKLTADKVRQIRILRAAGLSQRETANKFGVTRRCVVFIEQRKTWKHVKD